MEKHRRGFIPLILAFFGLFLGFRYLFPLISPFLLGAGLALLAEPLTKLLSIKLPRGLSAAVAVTGTFAILSLTLLLLGALVVRQLKLLPQIVPGLANAALTGMDALSRWLQALTYTAPENLGGYLRQNIGAFFSGGSAFLDKAAGWLLNLAGQIISHVPDSALGFGTALISSYMISAKLPRIRRRLAALLEKPPLAGTITALKRLRRTAGGWLLAQLKLSGITCLILSAGFLLLRIPHWPLWAGLTALVDAFPILGTGAVLVPWSLFCLVQGDVARGVGLMGIYAVVAVTRSVMEPRLVGRQLGLDPLITLFALYAGYRLWGVAGMLLAPMAAAMAAQLLPRDDKL